MNDMFIVRMKFEKQDWLYWAIDLDDKRKESPYAAPAFRPSPEEPEIIIFTLADARALVIEKVGATQNSHLKVYYQIRPWYCDSNDPRIEDYQSGGNAPESNLSSLDAIPEIVVTVEGGVVQDVTANIPRYTVKIIDLDVMEEDGEINDGDF